MRLEEISGGRLVQVSSYTQRHLDQVAQDYVQRQYCCLPSKMILMKLKDNSFLKHNSFLKCSEVQIIIRLDNRKKFFTEMVVRYWDRLFMAVLSSPSLSEFEEHLDYALSDIAWFVGSTMCSREYNLIVLVHPFQLSICCDAVIITQMLQLKHNFDWRN